MENEYNDYAPKPRNSSFRRSSKPQSQFMKTYIPEEKYDFKNFKIDYSKLIGTGGFSKIYLSKNLQDNNTYAVKIIPKELVKENGIAEEEVENVVMNEINIHEKIIHPNIIRMYSHYEHEQNYYCFLEYIQGPSLFTKNKGGLSEKEVNYLFNQIVQSISFCHKNHLVHRDIKSENFLYQSDTQKVKLCDFGWCVELTKSQPKRLTMCGTYEYMAPELFNEEPYDYSIDIWALGVLLYELLHGYSPFGNNDGGYGEIFAKATKVEYTINKDITNNCRDLLTKMLCKDVKKRIKINEILNHPWMNDWSQSQEKKEEENIRGDKYFDDIMNQVKNKNKGKKKKKGGNNKGNIKKNGIYKKLKGNIFNKEEEEKPQEVEEILKETKEPEMFSNKDNINIYNEEDDIIDAEEGEQYLKEENFIPNNNNNSNNNPVIVKKKEKEEKDDKEMNVLLLMKSMEEYEDKPNRIKAPKKNYNKHSNYIEDDFEILTSAKPHIEEKEVYKCDYSNELEKESKDLEDTLDMFAKAEKLKDTNQVKEVKEEQGFWSKIFAPFKCGN